MAGKRHRLIFFYLLLFNDILGAIHSPNEEIGAEDKRFLPFSSENLILLLKSFSAVDKSLEFFESVEEDIDIDGLLGVRIVADQLEVITQIMASSGSTKFWDQLIKNTVEDLKVKTQSLLDIGLAYVRHNDRKYFEGKTLAANRFSLSLLTPDIGGILDRGLWSHSANRNLSIRLSDKYQFVLALKDIPLNESTSDSCVSQMLHKCQISDRCLAMMTALGYQDYPLSHQVFFWEISTRVRVDLLILLHIQLNLF